MANWADLPTDILIVIAEGLTSMEDFIFLCAVCKSWRLVTSIIDKIMPLPPRLPLVMLPEPAETDVKVRKFVRFSTSEKAFEIELPEASGRKCVGANCGWLLTVGCDLKVNLLHPFTRKQISLPSLLRFEGFEKYHEKHIEHVIRYYIFKIVLSVDPWKHKLLLGKNQEVSDCIVVVINGDCSDLSCARIGDEEWTKIRVPSRSFDDLIYYKGDFYAVDCHGVIFVCNIDDKNGPKATAIAPPPSGTFDWHQKYLVEISGDLFLISRNRRRTVCKLEDCDKETAIHNTIGFSVWMLEECSSSCEGVSNKCYPYRFTEVKSLGDRAVFLGNNVTVSLPSEASPCIKANCIYFGDDNIEYFIPSQLGGGGGQDTGIFHMADGIVESHFAPKSLSNLSPPLWYI